MGFALSVYRFLFKTDTCYIILHYIRVRDCRTFTKQSEVSPESPPEGNAQRKFNEKTIIYFITLKSKNISHYFRYVRLLILVLYRTYLLSDYKIGNILAISFFIIGCYILQEL